jgi:serine protease
MRLWRWTATIAAVSLTLLALPATPSQADTASGEATIIVTFDKTQSNPEQAAKAAIEKAGGEVTDVQQLGPKIAAVTVADASTTEAKAIENSAEDQSGIKAAETSGKIYPTTTNDTYYSYLWNVNNASGSTYGVDAEDAWSSSTGDGAVIAILDTGITSNSDLNSHVIPGYDFIGNDTNPTDEGPESATDWHGTHVAGIAAAIANDGTGVFGVAPNAAIEPVRVMGASGGTDIELIAGIRWAAGLTGSGASTTNAHPADVLNLSLGGDVTDGCPTGVQTAINEAVAAGTAIVVAAGNGDSAGNGIALTNTYPANCENVIRVVATTYEGTLASYSNYGTSHLPATVAAPGGSGSSGSDATDWILSTWPSNSYMGMVGTSMAAPHVAGVVALLRAADSSLTVAQLTSLLKTTAEPLTNSCGSSSVGAGIVDAAAAVASATSTTSTRSNASTFTLATPTISGTAKVGRKLTAAASSSPTASSASYQWLVSGSDIAGATDSTYTLTAANLGKTISVKVAEVCSSRSSTKTSSTVKVAVGTFTKSASPKATGTYRVGHRLSASKGTWSPTPTSYSYRWLRDGKSIKSATHTTYKLTKSDRHHKISVRVTVKRTGYSTTSGTSSTHKIS